MGVARYASRVEDYNRKARRQIAEWCGAEAFSFDSGGALALQSRETFQQL
jgi:hypothetical protein